MIFSIALAILYKARKELREVKRIEDCLLHMPRYSKVLKAEKILNYSNGGQLAESGINLKVSRRDVSRLCEMYDDLLEKGNPPF